MIDSQAGRVSDQHALSRNVVSSNAAGVARPKETIAAKATITAMMAISTPIRKRRESMMSASAPAGSVNRNIGRLTRDLNQRYRHRVWR